MSEEKQRILDLSTKYVCPDRVRTFQEFGVDLVIGKREGYRIWDMDGHELYDVHLNGGTFNLGHHNAELRAAMFEAMNTFDLGNHHFPSIARAELAEKLAELTPGDLQYTVFSPSGGEAGDVAIKTARYATGRRKIVSLIKGYHGCTGLTVQAGDEKFSKIFHTEDQTGEFVRVPFGDLDAMEQALSGKDVAAVLMETIPATMGFPLVPDGYLPGVKALCEKYGTLYIADEVQTGLGRTGRMWAIEGYGVQPDMLTTAKGFGGGLYPIAATIMSKKVAGWLEEDGYAHASTGGGAEIGCRVAQKVLEITSREDVLEQGRHVAKYLRAGLEQIRTQYPFLAEIWQNGLVMGLKFDHPQGAVFAMRALYESGIWAILAGFDYSVLQFKPGLLLEDAECDTILERLAAAMEACKQTVA